MWRPPCEALRRGRTLLAVFTLVGLSGGISQAAAQETGTITGRVTDARTMQPLPSAQVSIAGLNTGVLTQANGRFLLLNVPAGSHVVAVQRIGYGSEEAAVTVTAGGAVNHDFSLQQEALALDEIIVTGTPGGTQRRAIGNVVAQVNVAQMRETAAISTVEDALSGRTPGMVVMPATGAGGGAKIRIRGHSSIGLPGEPIIYVDGVRLNDARTSQDRYSSQSRLQDFDPADIESIEIIKGPAAATLYGTEASNGVIQIVTKSGQSGAPVFDFSAELGTMWLPDRYLRDSWAPDPALCPRVPCASVDQLVRVNPARDDIARGIGSPFEHGLIQRYNIAVRGGTDLYRYSFSLNRSDQEGVVDWNNDVRNSVRAAIDIVATDNLSVALNGSYNQGTYSGPHYLWGGTYGWGGRPTTIFDTSLTSKRGWREPPEQFQKEFRNQQNNTQRSTWSIQTTHEATDWLTHRLTLGMDQVNERDELLFPRQGPNSQFWGTAGRIGRKTVDNLNSPVYTVDFSGTATTRFKNDKLGSATSYGMQYYNKQRRFTRALGENFAVAALSTVGAAAVTTADETFIENTTLGVYVQEQVDWDNRIFLTAAARADDNSAFGQDFDVAIYPKVSATWVMHEEGFWNTRLLEQFRLRAAWGAAGKQPDAFAASRLFRPETGPNQQPILTPTSFGNPNLGPERGEELEVGFDAAALDGRVGLNFTYYDRVTRDAIVAQTVPPSLWPGAAGDFAGATQFVNLGEVSAWGTESNLDLQLVPSGPVRWDMGVAFSTINTRIEDMGDVERIQVGRTRAHYEGFPVASVSDRRVVSAEFVNGDRGRVKNIMCDGGTGRHGLEIGGPAVPCADAPQLVWGPSEPKWMVNVSSTFTIFENLRASANIDAMGGHWMGSDYMSARHTSHPSSQLVWLQNDPIGQAYRQITRNGLAFHKAGFAKLREVSLNYSLPTGIVDRMGGSRANLQLGVRNVARLWTQQPSIFGEPVADPEMSRAQGGDFDFGGESGGDWPPLSNWTLRLNMTF